MAQRQEISSEEAKQVGAILGLDWTQFDLAEFRRGLVIELEHGNRDPETNVTNDDLVLTGKIAWAHLKEFPDYYARLERLEVEAGAYWAARGRAARHSTTAEYAVTQDPPGAPDVSSRHAKENPA